MAVVLGIDAAWGQRACSGFALVQGSPGAWRCLGCAPSFGSWRALVEGVEIDWSRRPVPAPLSVAGMLQVCRARVGCAPDVVAVDMPLGRGPVVGRRRAENEVNRRYGAAGCSTHSPLPDRPGPRSESLRKAWQAEGIPLRTKADASGSVPALLEVYPHVALLELCGVERRLPYKVSRSLRYWPGTSVHQRVRHLLTVWASILSALKNVFGDVGLQLPACDEVPSLAALKAHEDSLDALVCAWMGTRFLQGEAEPLGDDEGAIWVPRTP